MEWDDGDGAILPEHHEKVLSFLVALDRPARMAEVQEFVMKELALSASSAQWLLKDLMELGFVEKPSRGLYQPTEKGMSYMGYRDPAKQIAAAMEDIAEVATKLAEQNLVEEHDKLLRAQGLLEEVLKWFDKAAPR